MYTKSCACEKKIVSLQRFSVGTGGIERKKEAPTMDVSALRSL